MKRMFASATLKLTAWYLAILVAISLLFSFIIYEISTSEISSQLERLQIRIEGDNRTFTLPGPVTLNDIRINQTREAKASIFIGLVYMNLVVIGIGGIGSYLLAKRTLKPIEEAHEAQSRFTSDASHELRTPLAVMKSEIQVAMRDHSMKAGDYKKILESNLEEVDRLVALSQSLLQLSRLEFGTVNQTDRVNIIDAITSAATTLKIPKKRVDLQAPDRVVFIEGNESMISDLVRILLDNDVKYSPPESRIECKISSNGRTCRIAITNQGQGIQPKDIDKIFDRFYRGENYMAATGATGYGLGLSLAKKIVRLHDGSISVKSKPGDATTFTVAMPQIRKNR